MKIGDIYVNEKNVDCVQPIPPCRPGDFGAVDEPDNMKTRCAIRYSGGMWDRVNLPAEEVAQLLGLAVTPGLDFNGQQLEVLRVWREKLTGLQKKLGKPSRNLNAVLKDLNAILERSKPCP